MWFMMFEGRRRRDGDHRPPLSELPAWGLEMMMGLYGPETIKQVCAQERAAGLVGSTPSGWGPAPRPRRRLGVAAASSHRRRREVSAGDRPSARTADRRDDGVLTSGTEPLTPVNAELEAMNALVRYLGRKFRRD